MHTGKHRIKLTLSSEDVETHSFMSNEEEKFRKLANILSSVGIYHVKQEWKEDEKIANDGRGKTKTTRRPNRKR